MNIVPEMHRNGVLFASISASFGHGSLVHTGDVAGSIPAAPTISFNAVTRAKEVPTGSLELTGDFRLGGFVEIKLSRGLTAKVDADIAARLSVLTWSANAPQPGRYYAQAWSPEGKLVYLHRFVMGAPSGMMVDHINGDTLDCRRANLRLATPHQNACNARRQTRLFRGVTERPGKQYQARIKCRGRQISLGYFSDPVDAARAYDAKARELHGEFAVLNFSDGR